MTKRFTGFHMAAVLMAFFAVVIAVNMTMAVMASRTFRGTVVENTYAASQQYNSWLAEARRQQASRLDARIDFDVQRRLVLTIAPSVARKGAVPVGKAEHPLRGAADVPLRFLAIGPGRFRTEAPIPGGRWTVRISLATVDGQARLLERVS